MKKVLCMLLAGVMVFSLSACGSSSSSEDSTGAASGGDVSITIFNSKSEIQSQFEEMAQEYSAEKGVNVEVYYSNDTVAAHMATKYAANDPYTLAMVDAKDVYSLGAEHALDLSDQDWVKDTNYYKRIDCNIVPFFRGS